MPSCRTSCSPGKFASRSQARKELPLRPALRTRVKVWFGKVEDNLRLAQSGFNYQDRSRSHKRIKPLLTSITFLAGGHRNQSKLPHLVVVREAWTSGGNSVEWQTAAGWRRQDMVSYTESFLYLSLY